MVRLKPGAIDRGTTMYVRLVGLSARKFSAIDIADIVLPTPTP